MSRGRAAVALLLLAAPPLARPATAQHPAPFETIGLGLAVVGNIGRNDFHTTWDPSPGFELLLETPFHLGTVELGVEQLRFAARRPDVPGFRARTLFVGWGVDAALPARVRWRNGLRIGSYGMRFDADTLPAFRRDENEFAVELASRLTRPVAGRWSLSLAGRYRIVLTQPRIRHVYLSAGIGHTVTTPRWLRDFLD